MTTIQHSLKYLLVLSLLFGFSMFIGCDDDDDEISDSITHDEFLTGHWYRYSFQEDGLGNDFRPCRLEINDAGDIDKYLDSSDGQHVYESLLEQGYVIVNGGYREFRREDNTELWRGDFLFNADSSTVTFYNDSGYVDLYVKENTLVDTLVVGEWELELMTIDGTAQDIGNYQINHTFYLNGLLEIEGNPNSYTWFVNGEYLVIPNESEMVYYSRVCEYSLQYEDTRLGLTYNDLVVEEGELRTRNISMRFVRLD